MQLKHQGELQWIIKRYYLYALIFYFKKYLEDQLKNLKNLGYNLFSLIQKFQKDSGEIDVDEVLLRLLEIKEEKFDALIIDEAQDILDNDSYDILDNVFKNGFKGGVSYIFGDFEHQKIQNIKSQFDIFDFKDKSGFFFNYKKIKIT